MKGKRVRMRGRYWSEGEESENESDDIFGARGKIVRMRGRYWSEGEESENEREVLE